MTIAGLSDILSKIGFFSEEIEVYEVLIQNGSLTAGQIHEILPVIKKGLLYKTLDRLVERKVVEKDDRVEKAALFSPLPPDVILTLMTEQEKNVRETRALLEQLTPSLRAQYIRVTHRPLVRMYDGKEGLREVYEDVLASGVGHMSIVRPVHRVEAAHYFGRWFDEYQKKRIAAGIRISALTPGDPEKPSSPERDAANLYERVALNPDDYTANSEIRVYGDKIAFVSYGKELFALIVESEDFAHALRDILALAKRGSQTTQE